MSCNPQCKSCSHLILSMEESLGQKLNYLQSRLHSWMQFIEPVRSVEEAERWNYRDKVNLAMQYHEGSWLIGMLRRDELFPVFDCPVQTTRVNEVMKLTAQALPPVDNVPVVRFVQSGRQLTLVVKSNKLPSTAWITESFKEAFFNLGMEGLWLHLFPSTGKKVFGKGGWHLILGEPESQDETGMLYGPAAFRQLLPQLADDALSESAGFLKPLPGSVIVDLYSGTGSSLRKFTAGGATVVGVELYGESVKFSRKNAPAALVFQGTCTQRIPQLNEFIRNNSFKQKLLYVNPPRTGFEKEVTEWILDIFKPVRIAYLSCNALSLKNDLGQLTANAYSVDRIIPFDFFPRTRHVETLTLITKN